MALTKKQARNIADAFLEAAKAIDKYLDDNFNNIDRADYEFLNESHKTLLRVSSFATTVAVGLAIDKLANPAAELTNVIEQTKEKIEHLESVRDAIRFVAGLTNLAAGVIAKDAKTIVRSVKELKKLTNAETVHV